MKPGARIKHLSGHQVGPWKERLLCFSVAQLSVLQADRPEFRPPLHSFGPPQPVKNAGTILFCPQFGRCRFVDEDEFSGVEETEGTSEKTKSLSVPTTDLISFRAVSVRRVHSAEGPLNPLSPKRFESLRSAPERATLLCRARGQRKQGTVDSMLWGKRPQRPKNRALRNTCKRWPKRLKNFATHRTLFPTLEHTGANCCPRRKSSSKFFPTPISLKRTMFRTSGEQYPVGNNVRLAPKLEKPSLFFLGHRRQSRRPSHAFIPFPTPPNNFDCTPAQCA